MAWPLLLATGVTLTQRLVPVPPTSIFPFSTKLGSCEYAVTTILSAGVCEPSLTVNGKVDGSLLVQTLWSDGGVMVGGVFTVR